jgi:hypothetical protein
MNFAKTLAFMKAKDNSPPKGVKRMVVRKTASKQLRGGYCITMETSCGSDRPHIAGSVKLELNHPEFEKPLTKRFQVDNHREALDEFDKLVALVWAQA